MTVPQVRLTPLDTGQCWNIGALAERGQPWRPVPFPSLVVVVEHPGRGPVLVDTGYAPRVTAAMRRWPGWLYGVATPVRVGEPVVGQLAARGIAASEVRDVVLTHLHADHVGGLRDFPAARIHLAPAALHLASRARGLRAVTRAVLPELLPEDLPARAAPVCAVAVQHVGGIDLTAFGAAADLLGDGSVLAVDLPGHARGHLGVVVRDAGGPVLLAGDAAWSLRALLTGVDPHPVARSILDDPCRARVSAAAIRTWLARNPGARVQLAHDAATAADLASDHLSEREKDQP